MQYIKVIKKYFYLKKELFILHNKINKNELM